MDVEIISRARADTDYFIGYVDDEPAGIVIDDLPGRVGYYGIVKQGEYIECPYDGYRWYVEDGRWLSSHSSYPVPAGCTERQINDGDQEMLFLDDAFFLGD